MKNKVLESFNNYAIDRCVDIFVRPDSTFGFEEYRRDFEDGRWFAIGMYSNRVFDSQNDAIKDAETNVEWFFSQE